MPMLSKHISKGHFVFLENHQIMDVIGVAQQTLHGFKTKKLKMLVLNSEFG